MSSLNPTVEEIRNALGQYLTKPVLVTTGSLSTQQNLSVTSIGAGGVQGTWKFGVNGSIELFGTNNNLLIYLAGS